MYFNPERDFDIKIDCWRISFSLSIGVESHNSAGMYIDQPEDYTFAKARYIKLDHSATVEAALKGKSGLHRFLKEQIVAYLSP